MDSPYVFGWDQVVRVVLKARCLKGGVAGMLVEPVERVDEAAQELSWREVGVSRASGDPTFFAVGSLLWRMWLMNVVRRWPCRHDHHLSAVGFARRIGNLVSTEVKTPIPA